MPDEIKQQIFSDYAAIYDFLYKDKNYALESQYIIDELKRFAPGGVRILELGSGTGNYAQHLTKFGFIIKGIEQSEAMINLAKKKSIPGFSFIQSKIEDFEIDEQFDIAISLFHVISYLTTSENILKCFNQVNRHLVGNGIFLFDVWHGPAVVSQLPEPRRKRIENDGLIIERAANPVIDFDANTVSVNYDFSISADGKACAAFSETHILKYFREDEISFFAAATGFEVIESHEFVTRNKPSERSWSVSYILRKKESVDTSK